MRFRYGRIAVLLIVLAIAILTGCSRFSGPTDAEVLKAVEDAGLLKGGSFTITSPLTIVERNSRDENGLWPFKLKMTLVMKMADGKPSDPKPNMVIVHIAKFKDPAGNVIWKAMW